MPPKQLRDLRELTRLRTKYVQARTQNKNRVQKILNRVNIRLRTVLSDIFGRAGTELVEGLMAGKPIKTILKNTKNKQLHALSEEIEAVAQGSLSENDVFVLEQLIRAIRNVTEQIKQIDKRIATLTDKRVMDVLCSVPGVGVLAGATISAELGDPTRFSNCKQVASWCGFAPSVHQSAGVTVLGHITKRGSKALRWIMVEVAHAAVRTNDRFRGMFNRISVKRGRKVAYVAVARKILTIVWHLLCNSEKYVEEGFSKKTVVRVRSSNGGVLPVSLDALAEVLRNAGFVVSKG